MSRITVTIDLTGVPEAGELYDVLAAFGDGRFKTLGSGFEITTSETGPRQIRNLAQTLDHLAGLTERRRIDAGRCPADDLELDSEGLCPNTNCIYSREDRKVRR
jgi:hypothetical protein